jgi:hypothetical protein
VIHSKGGAPVTVKEGALYYAQGMGMPLACGTAKDIGLRTQYRYATLRENPLEPDDEAQPAIAYHV